MPRIVKLNNVRLHCFTPHEADRIPNVGIGKHCRIHTNQVLLREPKYNKLINDDTMGALDNYAQQEKMDIYITPLENDLFNDFKVSIFKRGYEDRIFPMNAPKSQKEAPEFLRELYTKIHTSMHPATESKPAKVEKSLLKDFKTYIENVGDRIHEYKMDKIQNFIDKNQSGKGIKRLMADALEETYFGDLY